EIVDSGWYKPTRVVPPIEAALLDQSSCTAKPAAELAETPLGINSLSKVSKYLNNLEAFLDDGDSLEAKKAPHRAFSETFMRFSTPCDVDGQGTWDVELDMADSHNYMTEEMSDKLAFVSIDYGDYGRKTVKEVRVEIHGFVFLLDFVVIRYDNEGEPSIIF
nr:hypothetical protein [Tanacetum cinerariifolium]